VRVTHRFHPLSGRSFEFVNRRKSWQSDRVYFFDDAGELACLPAEWTDVVLEDPFVVVSAGRSPFRTADLLELADWSGSCARVRGRCRLMSGGLRHECPWDSAVLPARHLPDLPCHHLGFPRHQDIPGFIAAWREGCGQFMRHSCLDRGVVREA
jgi:Family of unknown function (DUF5372)